MLPLFETKCPVCGRSCPSCNNSPYIEYFRHFQRAAARSTSCVVFIRIWREFDQDGDGQLDRNETIQLVKRLLAQQQQRIEDEFGVSRRQFYITDTELDVFVDTLVKYTITSFFGLHLFIKYHGLFLVPWL